MDDREAIARHGTTLSQNLTLVSSPYSLPTGFDRTPSDSLLEPKIPALVAPRVFNQNGLNTLLWLSSDSGALTDENEILNVTPLNISLRSIKQNYV